MNYETLELAYQDGNAVLVVDHVNHREFDYQGQRWICGWDSNSHNGKREPGWIVFTQSGAPAVQDGGATDAELRDRFSRMAVMAANHVTEDGCGFVTRGYQPAGESDE